MERITILTGKVRTINNVSELVSKSLIIPKNVKDVYYFQLACNYHALDLITTDYLNKELSFLFKNNVHDSEDIENLSQELQDEYNELIAYACKFSDEFAKSAESLREVSDKLLDEIENDIFAKMFVSSHLNINTRKKITHDDKGKEKLQTYDFKYWCTWSTAILDTNTLIKWNETRNASKKQEVFNYFRNQLNSCLTKTSRYTGKNFSKIGENLINNEFLTRCKSKFKSGKNGGFKSEIVKSPELFRTLFVVGLLFLGCEEVEIEQTTAFKMNVKALMNVQPLEDEESATEEPTTEEQETK